MCCVIKSGITHVIARVCVRVCVFVCILSEIITSGNAVYHCGPKLPVNKTQSCPAALVSSIHPIRTFSSQHVCVDRFY